MQKKGVKKRKMLLTKGKNFARIRKRSIERDRKTSQKKFEKS
jgi:hypothetical protein